MSRGVGASAAVPLASRSVEMVQGGSLWDSVGKSLYCSTSPVSSSVYWFGDVWRQTWAGTSPSACLHRASGWAQHLQRSVYILVRLFPCYFDAYVVKQSKMFLPLSEVFVVGRLLVVPKIHIPEAITELFTSCDGFTEVKVKYLGQLYCLLLDDHCKSEKSLIERVGPPLYSRAHGWPTMPRLP